MPKNDPALSFPVRGVAGGWRDVWDDPDDHAEMRARAEATERWQMRLAARILSALPDLLTRTPHPLLP